MNATFVPQIAIAYLARGVGLESEAFFRRFVDSYQSYEAGTPHRLYILYKGFGSPETLQSGMKIFAGIAHTPVLLDDSGFDIGAYIQWANQIQEDTICVFNTFSEFLCRDWLGKLARNFMQPGVGCVGASGSYESSKPLYESIPDFPNVHIRSNAFMIGRHDFVDMTRGLDIKTKLDALLFESGIRSMTRRIRAMGKEVLLVGRNGRGYAPKQWPYSNTFRQRNQGNLIVSDNQTRDFNAYPWEKKRSVARATWGDYLNFSKTSYDGFDSAAWRVA